ncbi:MAG: hypothetical protein AMXMBFR47_36060 [Planctomycetota bacterium]
MTKNDLQVILEGVFEQLAERHVCDDDCREGGCDRDTDDDWKEDIDADGSLAECGVTTFEAGGYLTRDAGLVVRTADGSEFQITIVQSRYGSDDDSDD